jgi:two-component system KDP operon response regulator KdpE
MNCGQTERPYRLKSVDSTARLKVGASWSTCLSYFRMEARRSSHAGTEAQAARPQRGMLANVSAGRILVVDDDPQIRRVMKVTLIGQGYEVADARSGEEAIEKLDKEQFDLVLLDMGMPEMGGLETCRVIRQRSEIGIIMLTVRDTESDKVEALDAGADDYITKPYTPRELLARIRAGLRRTPWMHGPVGRLTLGSVEVDFDTRQVTARGRNVRLTPKEFELLRYLVAHPNKVLSHRELLHRRSGAPTTAMRSITSASS